MKNKWVRISVIVILITVISASALYLSRVNAVSVDIAGKYKEFRPGLTTEQKLEDFEYLYNTLLDNFPYFDVEARKTGYYWPDHKIEFEGMIRNTKDDKEFYETIKEILRRVHNGHTDLITVDRYSYYQYMYKLFESKSGWTYKPWNDVIKNSYTAYEKWGEILNTPLEEYIPPEESLYHLQNVSSYIMEKDKIAYMKINSFGQEFVDVDNDRIKEFLISVKDYPYLIIDIRGNGGGSGTYWMNNILRYLLNEPVEYRLYNVFRNGEYIQPFIRAQINGYESEKRPSIEINQKNTPQEVKGKGFGSYIISERSFKPQEPIGFKGKIFLLTDRGVYSSSEAFAVFCKASGFATIVGSNTGGDGMGFDPVLVALPNSKLIFRFSCSMGLNPDGSSNEEVGTTPDIYVEQTRTDAALGKDSVIQKVLEIIKN